MLSGGMLTLTMQRRSGRCCTFVREGHRDWMGENDEDTTRNIEYLRAFGVMSPDACSKHGVTYFESIDYLETIDQAIHFLVQSK